MGVWSRLLVAAVGLAVSSCGQAGTSDGEAGGPAIGTLEWAATGDWRTDEQKARDAWRHPVETLRFFGVEGDDTVVELFPGGGWYSEILAPYLKAGGGQLIAAGPDPAASDYARRNVEAYSAHFGADPDLYGNIMLTIASRDSDGIAPEGAADVVLTFRNIHNWMAGGYADKIFADAYRALKPGGVLGVVEHRLPSAWDQDLAARTGYVHQAYVVELAQDAGFEFVEASEINANPGDPANHPLGVWMLPPNLRAPAADSPEAEAYDPEIYTTIGESDRMTLLFRKPAPPSEAAPEPASRQDPVEASGPI